MRISRRLILLTATVITSLSVAFTGSAFAVGSSTQVHGMTPDGTQYTAISDGDRLLVKKSIDPDGYIPNPAASRKSPDTQPPTCVGARDNHPVIGLAYLYVDNGCTTTQRVKVLIAFGPDSECMILAPKTTQEFNYPNASSFDGLVAC